MWQICKLRRLDRESITYHPFNSFVKATEQLLNSLVYAGWSILWGWEEKVHKLFFPFLYEVGKSISSVQFSSVSQLCPTLWDPMNRSMPGHPVHHQLPEFTQTHVHWVGDAIQPSHPLLSPSPPALNLSQHQGLFKWVSSSHQVAKVLEFQLPHQSFQWTPRTDLL